jgi:RNA-directed DNA polymerase
MFTCKQDSDKNMAEQTTRQQLYDRIKAAFSKDAFILEEMKRLGFWDNSPTPTVSENLIQKEAKLQKELNELVEKQQQYNSREAMLKEMRAAKFKASKEKIAATKLRNEQKKQEKSQKWAETQEKQIIYLGKSVSQGLNNTVSDLVLLQKHNLPHFADIATLASNMGLTLAQLRFLAFDRNISTVCHYNYFSIPKKSGGKRLISAPKTLLKTAQTWILENILYKVPTQEVVHGFVPKHSIKTNAVPHLNKAVVINLDLKDFFPSIGYKRVKGLFMKMGYAEQFATLFALLCTQTEVEKLNVDGQIFYAQKGERVLPQGSPASPAITTLIAYKMDLRLQGLAKKYDFTYTRYADDLTFSADHADEKKIGALLAYTKQVVENEDFILHPDKTKIMRKGSQKKVTGIVVNEKASVDRSTLRKFRALLHQAGQTGWENKQWGNSQNVVNSVLGFANFVAMVDAQKGKGLKEQIATLLKKYPISDIKQTATKTGQQENELQVADNQIVSNPKETQKENSKENNKDWWDIFES